MMLRRRELMLATATGPVIPAGFTELAYIESSGSQYAIADVQLTSKTDIVSATFACTNGVLYPDMAIIGGSIATFGVAIGSMSREWPYTQKPVMGYVGYRGATGGLATLNEFVSATVNAATFTLEYNGQTFPIEQTNRDISDNTYIICNGRIKVKFAEIMGKGLYKSVKRDADGVVGFYNLLTGAFCTNAGTGTFGYETLDGVYTAPQS